jgi:hypothetical protein
MIYEPEMKSHHTGYNLRQGVPYGVIVQVLHLYGLGLLL